MPTTIRIGINIYCFSTVYLTGGTSIFIRLLGFKLCLEFLVRSFSSKFQFDPRSGSRFTLDPDGRLVQVNDLAGDG